MKTKVKIVVISYNQEKYIRETLQNIISQKTNFVFEAYISDDCSTDNTVKIINEFSKKYPNIIKPTIREKNVGVVLNYLETLKQCCDADYVALCEGDDYWCDEYKLQKQVDFMEANPDYAICYHPARMIYMDKNHEPIIIGQSEYKNPQPYYNLIKANNIPANSVIYRAKYLQEELKNYPEDIYPPDWFTHISVARHGKIGYLPDVMYVYRWHSQGISHTTSNDPVKEIHLKYGVKEVNFSYTVWNKIKDRYPKYYSEIFINTLQNIYFTYLQESKFKEIDILTKKYSQYFKDFKLNINKEELKKYENKCRKYRKMYNMFLITSIVFFILSIFLATCLIIKP